MLTSAGLAALLALALATAASADPIVVEPRETDELLASPGMGWQTFHAFADQDPNLKGLPSSSAYFRLYWREIEPANGRVDFAKLDDLLAHAHRAGQKLAFRVMCTGSGEPMDVPAWLKEQGCRGVEFEYGGRKHWVPDFTDPLFEKAHNGLIRALGKRYDGHPDLDLVDIGSVGLWGEWHMSGTKDTATGKEVPLPPIATRLAIIDAWRAAFPQTPKVMLIGGDEALAHAVAYGCGWRADCLGDMGGFSKSWNHMDNFYLQALKATKAEEAWRAAPVAFETCWDMRKWKDEGWEIHYIWDYALRLHTSYINNKSQPIPEGTRPEVERMLRRLGYRLVLRRAEHEAAARRGGSLRIQTRWENVGTAPPYRDYRVAIRLKGPATRVWRSDETVRGWLPGTRDLLLQVPLPRTTPAGTYEVAIAVTDPASGRPAVPLAIEGRQADGWYRLSAATLR